MNGTSEFEGKWLNMRTGQYVVVSNVLNDETGNMIFVTNQGTIPGEVFSRDYVKDDNNDEVNIDANNSSLIENSLNANDYLVDDFPVTNDVINNNEKNIQVSTNHIIDKIFKKINTTPKISLKIDWPELPINDIKTIVSYLEDITIDDISKYIIDKYLTKDDISKVLSSIFEKYDDSEK